MGRIYCFLGRRMKISRIDWIRGAKGELLDYFGEFLPGKLVRLTSLEKIFVHSFLIASSVVYSSNGSHYCVSTR